MVVLGLGPLSISQVDIDRSSSGSISGLSGVSTDNEEEEGFDVAEWWVGSSPTDGAAPSECDSLIKRTDEDQTDRVGSVSYHHLRLVTPCPIVILC